MQIVNTIVHSESTIAEIGVPRPCDEIIEELFKIRNRTDEEVIFRLIRAFHLGLLKGRDEI